MVVTMKRKGRLITFEGSEGSGKSTQMALLYQYLLAKKKDVLTIREPGGVDISEAIRKILLDVKNAHMSRLCETLLYMAARAQLVEQKIYPALKKGTIVLCDRFLDSTVVYQGYASGISLEFINAVGEIVTQRLVPDVTFLFDLPVQQGLARRGKIKDRIELKSLNYHQKVRQGYLTLAKEEPHRIKVVKADRSSQEISREVCTYVDQVLK